MTLLKWLWTAFLRRLPWPLLLLFGLAAIVLVPLLQLAGWLLLRTALAAKRHPDLSVATLASGGLWYLWTAHPVSYPASGAVLAVAFVWSNVWPQSFDACLGNRLRARYRRWSYARHWATACTVTGLSTPSPQGPLPPRILRVRSPRPDLDILTAEADPPTPDAWRKTAHELARILNVHTIRIRPGKRGRAELWAYRTDPLFQPVEPLTSTDNLERVPVAIREDGQLFHLPVLYSHTLVAGETGAGKGSVIWSLIGGVAPLVHSGHVRLWVIDPKMVEMAAGEPLFDEFIYGRAQGEAPWQTEMAEMLEDAVDSMRARAERLRGITRKHVPTVDQPLILIVVDEIASLTAYVGDPTLRRRIADALSLLLSQGRALGISVIAATQDARKEVLGYRDLFPVRVALRAAEAPQADMVLGRGAYERGAHTHRISQETPGVAYVSVEDSPDPIRVRFSYWDDQAIAEAVRRYGRAPARSNATGALTT